MKCWKCSNELIDGMSTCTCCGANLVRSNPKSLEGKALRQLYDHFGADTLLNNPTLLVNGFGDLCPDEKKRKSQLKLIADSGVLKMYKTQLEIEGKPTESFDIRVEKSILDIGLSATVAREMISLFSEMIGWSTNTAEQREPAKTNSSNPDKKQTFERGVYLHEPNPLVTQPPRHVPQSQTSRKTKRKKVSARTIIASALVLMILSIVIFVKLRNQKGNYELSLEWNPEICKYETVVNGNIIPWDSTMEQVAKSLKNLGIDASNGGKITLKQGEDGNFKLLGINLDKKEYVEFHSSLNDKTVFEEVWIEYDSDLDLNTGTFSLLSKDFVSAAVSFYDQLRSKGVNMGKIRIFPSELESDVLKSDNMSEIIQSLIEHADEYTSLTVPLLSENGVQSNAEFYIRKAYSFSTSFRWSVGLLLKSYSLFPGSV